MMNQDIVSFIILASQASHTRNLNNQGSSGPLLLRICAHWIARTFIKNIRLSVGSLVTREAANENFLQRNLSKHVVHLVE